MSTPGTVVRPDSFDPLPGTPPPLTPGDQRRGGAAPAKWFGDAPPVLVGIAVLVAIFALLPLFFVIGQAVQVGWSEFSRLVFRARVAELLTNTVLMVVVSTAACGAIGTTAAWLVERTDLWGRRLLAPLLAAPLAIPAFVSGYGWVSLTSSVQGFGGALLIVTLSYYPLVYLPVIAGLRGMDPALEETALSLGLGRWKAFRRVVLPQLTPALGGGMLIVALHLLSEFGAFQLLRFHTFTTAIYSEYTSSFDGPAANMLSMILVLLCLVLLIGEVRLRGQKRYARTGSGAARTQEPVRLGRFTPLALLGIGAVLILALGVPIGSMIHWLVIGSSAAFPLGPLAAAAGTSLGLGLAAALTTTMLAIPVALLVERHPGKLATLLERSTYVAHALPGIVIALALIYLSIRMARPFYQSMPLLILGYAILFLPMAMVGVRAALAQSPPILAESARALGQRPIAAFWRVTLRLILPGLGASAALVFLMVATELTSTLLLAPIGTNTLATQVWSASTSLEYGAAAPYALLMVLISIPSVYLLTRRVNRNEVV